MKRKGAQRIRFGESPRQRKKPSAKTEGSNPLNIAVWSGRLTAGPRLGETKRAQKGHSTPKRGGEWNCGAAIADPAAEPSIGPDSLHVGSRGKGTHSTTVDAGEDERILVDTGAGDAESCRLPGSQPVTAGVK